jgi:hypothetical protein
MRQQESSEMISAVGAWPGPPHRPATRLVGWTVLAACLALVVRWGQPGWIGPRLPARPGAWSGWLAEQGAVPAAFAVVRVVTLAVGLQLAVVLVAAVAARAARWRSPVQVLHAISLPVARRLVDLVVGVGALSLAVPPVGAMAGPRRHPAVAMVAAPAATGTAPAREAASETAELPDLSDVEVIVLDEGPPVGAERDQLPSPAATPVDADPVGPVGPDGQAAELWEVRPGEHFWSIAEQVLTTAWAGPVTDADVAPYWAALVEANRDRLASPGDVDLVYPGQVMELPPVPPPPAPPSIAAAAA